MQLFLFRNPATLNQIKPKHEASRIAREVQAYFETEAEAPESPEPRLFVIHGTGEVSFSFGVFVFCFFGGLGLKASRVHMGFARFHTSDFVGIDFGVQSYQCIAGFQVAPRSSVRRCVPV